MSTGPKPSAKFRHTWAWASKWWLFLLGLRLWRHLLIIVTVLWKCLLKSPQISSRKFMYSLLRQIRLFPPDNYTETHSQSQFVYLHPTPIKWEYKYWGQKKSLNSALFSPPLLSLFSEEMDISQKTSWCSHLSSI